MREAQIYSESLLRLVATEETDSSIDFYNFYWMKKEKSTPEIFNSLVRADEAGKMVQLTSEDTFELSMPYRLFGESLEEFNERRTSFKNFFEGFGFNSEVHWTGGLFDFIVNNLNIEDLIKICDDNEFQRLIGRYNRGMWNVTIH